MRVTVKVSGASCIVYKYIVELYSYLRELTIIYYYWRGSLVEWRLMCE